jgi:hypothetical protein
MANIPQLPQPAGIGAGQTAMNKGAVKNNEKMAQLQQADIDKAATSARANRIIAQEMLDVLNDNHGVTTGAFATWINDNKARLVQLGVPGIDIGKVANGQEMDKLARVLASTGLKTIYGGRITNMELDQALKSNPNANLTELAIRTLIKLETLKDDSILHYQSFAHQYLSQPTANASMMDQWYRRYLDPFSQSEVVKNAGGIPFGGNHLPNAQGLIADLPAKDPLNAGWMLHKDKNGGVAYVSPDNLHYRVPQ